MRPMDEEEQEAYMLEEALPHYFGKLDGREELDLDSYWTVLLP